MATTISTLTKDVFATTIHGITGQQIDEGVLAAGALVRKIEREETLDGVRTRFEASADGGRRWFLQTTYDSVETAGSTPGTRPESRETAE